MMRRHLAALAFCLAWLPIACAQPSIRSFDSGSLGRIEAEYRGKPFVVVLWSLDCAYCESSFAALVGARQAYGYEIVTVATDRLVDGDNASQIAKRLDAFGLRPNAWAFDAATPPEQLRYAIDPKWYGELPRSYWFDGTGRRAARSGRITPEMIRGLFPAGPN
ncbi:MAG TPA: hypothetical protein VEC06_10755 [Paucimonas sp.]|nr:hypothetical protein [Paucimonas sp.]